MLEHAFRVGFSTAVQLLLESFKGNWAHLLLIYIKNIPLGLICGFGHISAPESTLMGMSELQLMGKYPGEKRFITLFTSGHLQNDIDQFLLGVRQFDAVQGQKDKHNMCADPLVAIDKRVVLDQTIAEPGRLLLKRGVGAGITETLEWRIKR